MFFFLCIVCLVMINFHFIFTFVTAYLCVQYTNLVTIRCSGIWLMYDVLCRGKILQQAMLHRFNQNTSKISTIGRSKAWKVIEQSHNRQLKIIIIRRHDMECNICILKKSFNVGNESRISNRFIKCEQQKKQRNVSKLVENTGLKKSILVVLLFWNTLRWLRKGFEIIEKT